MSEKSNGIAGALKGVARNLENAVKAPYRDMRKARLRKEIRLDKNSANYVAHRGLSACAPENTITAFKMAAERGFASMETDIRRTKDKKLVLMHDPTLKRMCGMDVPVCDLTYSELVRIPITGGKNADVYADDPDLYVPLLSRFLEICSKSGILPMLELKDNWNVDIPLPDEYLEDILREIRKILGDRPVIFVSFNLNSLISMQRLLKEKKMENVTLFHLMTKIDPERIPWYKEHDINLSVRARDNKLKVLRQVKDAGLKLVVWVVDNPDQARLYIKTDVDWIASNGQVWEE